MPISDDSVQADLVQVGGLQLQHLMNTFSVDLVRSLNDILGSTILASKAGVDQLFAVLIEQVEGVEMRAGRDLDKLGEPITDLRHRQGPQEGEVEEGMHWCMVCTKPVLVVAIVDSNLDRHRSVYQTNDSSRHPDEVGVPAIGGTSEPDR